MEGIADEIRQVIDTQRFIILFPLLWQIFEFLKKEKTITERNFRHPVKPHGPPERAQVHLHEGHGGMQSSGGELEGSHPVWPRTLLLVTALAAKELLWLLENMAPKTFLKEPMGFGLEEGPREGAGAGGRS